MMCLEGVQRPIGISHHSDPSFSADQDGHVRRSVAGLHCVFRRIEDLNGVVDEPAHEFLIGTVKRTLNVFYGAAMYGRKLSLAQPAIHGQYLSRDEISCIQKIEHRLRHFFHSPHASRRRGRNHLFHARLLSR
jgi:hypothetical protein